MKTHFIFVPNDLETGETQSFTSLRHLCKDYSLPYANVHYRVIRKGGVFETAEGKILKAKHFEGVKRGKSF